MGLPKFVALAKERNTMGIDLWVMDEMRYGLRTDLGKRITAKGVKPLGKTQHRYQFGYLYGAIQAFTGERVMMQTQAMNADFFQQFLYALSQEDPMMLKVLILDNSSTHKAKKLICPQNIVLLFLPPYSPELNPAERFWQEIRRALKNCLFNSLADLEKALYEIILSFNKEQLISITAYPYLKNVWNYKQKLVA